MQLPAPITLALLAVIATATEAARAQSCRIEASGAQDGEWSAATASLQELALSERECTEVRIHVAAGQAQVHFTTADGRSAERIVTTPADLRATVNALRVQGPAAAAPEAPVKPASAAVPTPTAPMQSAPNPTHLRFALLAGVRGAEELASPLLTGEVALGLGIFELGAALAAEVQYFDMAGMRSPDRQSGAAAFSLHAGVRQPSGSFDLRAGVRGTFALLLTVNHESQSCPVGVICDFLLEDERADEWRLGLYTGFVVPRASSLRFRTDLGLDVVTPAADERALPLTPSLGMSLVLGIEVAP
jgi:hypothetical protein